MTAPLIVSIPHRLGKQGAISRLRTGLSQVASSWGHIVKVEEETWQGDSLFVRFRAVGQSASSVIHVFEDHLRCEIALPWLLAKMSQRFVPAMQKEATLLLNKK